MRKQQKEEITEKGKLSPLWLLEMRIARQNKLLINLKSQGVNYNNSSWRNIISKRNLYRNILIEKLKEWKKGKMEESNPNYNDYLSYQKDKNQKEGDYENNY
ncbi:MAG: hypothetical protein AABY22_24730 [Nanoarchaeota archaeon]